MAAEYLQVIAPVIGLAVNVVLQVAVFRMSGSSGLLKSVVLAFAAGFFATSLIGIAALSACGLSPADFLALSLVEIITYSALGYSYFHFINLGETARRVRILTEVHNAPGGLSMGEITRRYSAKDMIGIRIMRLLKSGQVIYKNGVYTIGSPVLLIMAKAVTMMRRVIFGKRANG